VELESPTTLFPKIPGQRVFVGVTVTLTGWVEVGDGVKVGVPVMQAQVGVFVGLVMVPVGVKVGEVEPRVGVAVRVPFGGWGQVVQGPVRGLQPEERKRQVEANTSKAQPDFWMRDIKSLRTPWFSLT